MSCGRANHWAGSAGSSAGYVGMPRMSGFAAELTTWARSSQLRVGDAERDSAVRALGEHFAAGRLTHDELDERTTAAWSARTAGELTALFSDLPRPHATPTPPARSLAPRSRRPRFPLLPAVALSIVVAILTPVPFLVVLLVAWLTFVSMVRPALTRHTSGSRRAVRGTWS